VPTHLTKLLQRLPVERRVRFFRVLTISALPEPHRQRFVVRGLLPLLMPFLLDPDRCVWAPEPHEVTGKWRIALISPIPVRPTRC